MAIIMSHQSAAKHIVNIGVRAGLTYPLLRNTIVNKRPVFISKLRHD